MRAVKYRNVTEVCSRFGRLRRNWPARKRSVRELAHADRKGQTREWPQKTRSKSALERLSLCSPTYIRNRFHSAATCTEVAFADGVHAWQISRGVRIHGTELLSLPILIAATQPPLPPTTFCPLAS